MVMLPQVGRLEKLRFVVVAAELVVVSWGYLLWFHPYSLKMGPEEI